VLLASLASEGESASLSVAYDRRANSLLVKPGRLAGIGGRDHELWIIPAGGTPISLGLISGTGPQRLSVAGEAAGHFRPNAAIAVSVEPSGGSPTGAPTGPVIAAGELLPV
jgi:anti-sigma-K factor RskA